MKAHKKPHKHRGRFSNIAGEPSKGFLARTLAMAGYSLFKRLTNRWVMMPALGGIIPERSHDLLVTWIGHATFLIQVGGLNILTDPLFGRPSFLFPRLTPPGISLQALPPLDVILISHNHWDHMEAVALSFLQPLLNERGGHVLVPEGDHHWFIKRGFKNVVGASWWQQQVKGAITYTFLPAHHWSQRGLFDRNRSLWGSWLIQSTDCTLYFGGDSAYGDHFREIADEFSTIDCALLPIGPCEPRHALKHSHMNAEEAGQAFVDLKANYFIPMHWGTFNFGIDDPLLPLKRLQNWWTYHHATIHAYELIVLKQGQSHLFNKAHLSQVRYNQETFSSYKQPGQTVSVNTQELKDLLPAED
jgi:L-ascorbate metabolism protein UlaG (beta-lactamase superfamily)